MKNKMRTAPVLLLYLFTISVSLHAAVHHVDSTASAGGDGSNWDNAFTDLQSALAIAGEGDEVHVAAGVYYPDVGAGQVDDDPSSVFQLKTGVALLGGFPTGGSDLSERDPLTNLTVLSGDLDQNDTAPFEGYTLNAYHVVVGSGVDATAILDGFVISAGNADGSGSDRRGGGLQCIDGSPTIRNCTFTGNFGQIGGGAYICRDSSPAFTNCSFIGNEGQGGGMYTCQGAAPVLVNCLFAGNRSSGNGGAVYSDLNSSCTYINCTFTGNSARRPGGAVYNSRQSSPQFVNCIIWNNVSDGSTDTTEASVANDTDSLPSYAFSLIANSGGSAGWNTALGTDDGNNLDLDPLFLVNFDPLLTPSTDGDARLLEGSPALDAGNNSDNLTDLDLKREPRIQESTIDLGAFEGASGPAFSRVLYVDQSATGGETGASWVDAYRFLQDALLDAGPGEAIYVAMGRYYPDEGNGQAEDDPFATFQLKTDVTLLGGFPPGGGELAQRNPASNLTVLSGDIDQNDEGPFLNTSGNAYNVVNGSGVGNTAVLDGFTIASGNAVGPTFLLRRGGGILIYGDGSPLIRNCTLISNYGEIGGAVTICDDSFPTFLNCAFIGNRAIYGGAAFICLSSTPVMTNCIFQGNSATQQGGALYNDVLSSPLITSCSFSGNRALSAGGAVFNTRSSSPVFSNCIIWNNVSGQSSDTIVASIANDETSLPIFSNSLVANSGGSSDWDSAIGIDDGNNLDADPLFVLGPEPLAAPGTVGSLRLMEASPALDAGDDEANGTSLDLAGLARIQDSAIDIGAYEGAFTPRFETFYPGLVKSQDSNDNGFTNFNDYAHGESPLGLFLKDISPGLAYSGQTLLLTMSQRFEVEDVFVSWQRSPSLQPGSWTQLQLGTDYSSVLLLVDGVRLISEIEVPSSPENAVFYRQVFRDTPF